MMKSGSERVFSHWQSQMKLRSTDAEASMPKMEKSDVWSSGHFSLSPSQVSVTSNSILDGFSGVLCWTLEQIDSSWSAGWSVLQYALTLTLTPASFKSWPGYWRETFCESRRYSSATICSILVESWESSPTVAWGSSFSNSCYNDNKMKVRNSKFPICTIFLVSCFLILSNGKNNQNFFLIDNINNLANWGIIKSICLGVIPHIPFFW